MIEMRHEFRVFVPFFFQMRMLEIDIYFALFQFILLILFHLIFVSVCSTQMFLALIR